MEQLAEITLGQMFSGIAGIIVLLSVFIEITPFKINPVSNFLKWFGKKTNGELMEKVSSLEKEVTNIKEDAAKRNAVNCKVRILNFGDELRRNVQHSKEHFDQILEDIDNYGRYCNEHPEFKNKKTVVTTSMILEAYTNCVENNKFL